MSAKEAVSIRERPKRNPWTLRGCRTWSDRLSLKQTSWLIQLVTLPHLPLQLLSLQCWRVFLSLQVKELEQILRHRNPNSLPALIYAAATAGSHDDEPTRTSPPSRISAMLERRIQRLEAELESHDEEAKRSLRAMEQQFHRFKVQFKSIQHTAQMSTDGIKALNVILQQVTSVKTYLISQNDKWWSNITSSSLLYIHMTI